MTPRRLRALALGTISVVALAVVVAVYELPHLKLVATPAPAAEPVASAPVETKEGELIDFAFLSPTRGWAAATATSDDLWIYFTPDGGKHWRNLSVIPGAGFGTPQLHVLDARNLWLVAETGGSAIDIVVYKSPDGGAAWTQVVVPDAAVLDVGFTDPYHGGATAPSQRLYVTDDGGVTWRRQPDLPPMAFAPVFRNPNEGWAIGDSVYSTFDGGRTWQAHDLPPAPDCPPKECVSPKSSVTLLGDAGVFAGDYVSLDRGASWRYVPPPPGGASYEQIAYQDSLHWWVVQDNTLYKTSDAGERWTTATTRVIYDHLMPTILDAKHAWTVQRIFDDSQPNRRPFPAFELDVTSDGGLNWKTVPVPVPG